MISLVKSFPYPDKQEKPEEGRKITAVGTIGYK